MANHKKVLASAAIAAGLLGGGIGGLILGVPGTSGAQTTTVPSPPGTTAPAPNSGQDNPDRPPHRGNCPNMGREAPSGGTPGQAPATGTNTNIAFRHFRGGGVRA